MKILVIAEHDNQHLKTATLNTITAAQQIGEDVSVLVAGSNCAEVAAEITKVAGVKAVLLANNEVYEHALAENTADLIADIGQEYSYIFAPATTTGKNVLPRVAALLDVSQISDIIEIVSEDTFKRPIYAGNAIATVQTTESIKVATVRVTAFDAAENSSGSAEIKHLDIVKENTLSVFVKEDLASTERPELTAANIVISGGRGLESSKNFEQIYHIADKLGAAVGASRAAVDAGYVPNDMQVGQTGKIVAPDLYIAVGISGAIQHLAGMKESKVVVAINKDEDAPIFQVADYGLVADLFDALPQLDKLL